MVTAPIYPKWCDRKLWTIHESICLLLEVEPETRWLRDSHDVGGIDPLMNAFEQYCELAIDAMKEGSLVPFSPWDSTRPPLERRVIPRSFLQWAKTLRVSIPEELAPLLAQQPSETLAPAPSTPSPSVLELIGRGSVLQNQTVSSEAREQVLGAALAALRSFPERCTSASGIRQVVEENAPLIWTETRKPPMASDQIERLISHWLGRLG